VENHKLVHGRILDEIIRLPRPDFVFIGGGGPELEEILKRVYHYIAPGGRIAATAVTLESSSLLQKTLKSAFKSAVSVIVSRSAEVGASTMMKSENPITVFTFEKGI
jgi:precorrin-6B methylase 2